jgi:signal transduction histidine kinase
VAEVLVEIGDNGPGIPEAAAHILEPFYTTKPGTAW